MTLKARVKAAVRGSARGIVRAACGAIPDRLAVLVHESTDLVRRLDFADKPILLHAESEVELVVRLRSVAKEPEMLPWLRETLRPGDVFYDVGANVGAYSLLAAALHDGNLDVVSFEPSATNYAQLCRNVALNPWARRVRPLPLALGETRGLLSFAYSELTAGAALHAVGAAADGVRQQYVQAVMSVPLDALIAEYRLPSPTVMKIDVDGGELPILLGARETLSDPAVRSILIELEDATAETAEVQKLLTAWGYREVRRGAWAEGTLRGRTVRNANHIYERVPAAHLADTSRDVSEPVT